MSFSSPSLLIQSAAKDLAGLVDDPLRVHPSIVAMTQFFVYILASHSRVLYTGVTRNLLRRVYQHRIGGAVGFVGPSLADGRWRYGGTDGEIYYSIFYGRPRGMPAWGGTLPPDAIWTIVSYLQSLQPAKDTLSTTTW